MSPLVAFAFFSGFSATTFYDILLHQLFNLVPTCLPICVYALLDRKYSKEELLADPLLYTGGQSNSEFSFMIFLAGLFKGFAYGLAVGWLNFYCFGNSLTPRGFTSDLFLDGSVGYGCVVLVVTAKILFDSHNHTKLSITLIMLSVLAYYVLCYFMSTLPFAFSKTFDQVNEERQFKISFVVYIFVFLGTIPVETVQYHIREWFSDR